MACFPPTEVLHALGVNYVDYFSLDVEGHELSVLDALDFRQTYVKWFTIEFPPPRHLKSRQGLAHLREIRKKFAALRAQRSASRPRNDLERQILTWVAERIRRSGVPGGDATPMSFGKAHNIGVQRARKAFVRLERDGLLVAHGRTGSARIYGLP